jgi:hypothetical protein
MSANGPPKAPTAGDADDVGRHDEQAGEPAGDDGTALRMLRDIMGADAAPEAARKPSRGRVDGRRARPSTDPADIRRANAARVERYARSADFEGPQATPHRKPNPGGAGEPCDVCGCPGLRLGTLHRALVFGEYRPPGAAYVKSTSNTFGTDSMLTYLDYEGRAVG